LRFEEQLRLSQQTLADDPRTAAPGVIKPPGFARIAVVLREGHGHALAIRQADPCYRSQKSHRHVRRDLAFAHLLLDRFRQLFHQRQPPRHPAHAPIEPPRQLLESVAETLLHLRQQPSLLQRRLPFRPPRAAVQHQRLGFRHRPDHRFHRVPAQLLEGCDALIAVDHQVAIRMAFHRHHHNRRLLPGCRQRRQQPSLSRRMPRPKMFPPPVELVKLQSHARFVSGSVCGGRARVFLGRNRMSTRNSRRISDIPADLVFRGAHQEYAHNTKKISCLPADLVFRQIPRKSVQRRRNTQRLRCPFLGMPTLEAIARGVIRVLRAPPRLRLLPPGRLALRFRARMLACSHPRVRTEPAAANRAWSLPVGGHRDSSSPLPRTRRSDDPGQTIPVRRPGSLLESRSGSFFASAEGPNFPELELRRSGGALLRSRTACSGTQPSQITRPSDLEVLCPKLRPVGSAKRTRHAHEKHTALQKIGGELVCRADSRPGPAVRAPERGAVIWL